MQPGTSQPGLEVVMPVMSQLLRRAATLPSSVLYGFDTPGPRYTSYPTADRFVETFGASEAAEAMRGRSQAAGDASRSLSLYVHIPFCESVCYYCACNKVITKHHERAGEYLTALGMEVDLVRAGFGAGTPVSQLHLGGGSPTFLSDAELERVMRLLGDTFHIVDGAEISIEVDPRTVTAARLAHLRRLGFNRISFGVQDFDADVQRAVHREQSFESVRGLMHSARELRFDSINADLIYGLPKQTPDSFAHTVEQIVDLRPDRIALYAYAHLPGRFKPQRRILPVDLPDAVQRVAMLGGAIEGFCAAGYGYIGMDHFALPDDPLAVAKQEGRLHRNFQGYSTQPDCDLIGLGVSAISRVGATYYQNAKTLPEYYAALGERRLPVVRGISLDADDLLRRDAIMALMCQGRLDFAGISAAHGIDPRSYFSAELTRLRSCIDAGLVEVDAETIRVTPTGWYVVRAIAMVFDRHLQAGARERFSRIV